MTARQDSLRQETHAAVFKSIDQFLAIIEKIGQQESVQTAFAKAPTAITRGRSFVETAVDDLIDAFEVIMHEAKDEEIPVDYYQRLLSAREGMEVSREDAQTELSSQLAKKRSAPNVATRAVPAFIDTVFDKVPPQIAQTLAQNWMVTLQNINTLVLPETALRAQNNVMTLRRAFTVALEQRQGEQEEMKRKLQSLSAERQQQQKAPAPEQNNQSRAVATISTDLPEELKKLFEAFGEDLTEIAKKDADTPVVGRDEDIDRTMATLVRSSKPFALLAGTEGVGKSAVTTGLARRIVEGNAPAELKDAKVVRLKLREMKASSGTSQGAHKATGESRMFDQFTNWLHTILDETAKYNAKGGPQIILDIDELGEIGGRIPTMFQAKDVIVSAMADKKGLRLIGEISDVKRRAIEETSSSMLDEFAEIRIKPLSKELTIEALKLNGFDGVEDDLLKKTIEWTNQFINKGEQPGKALDVLVSAESRAKLTGAKMSEGDVVQILSDLTGRPKHMFGKSKNDQMAELETELPKRVVGQPVIEDILKVIKAGNSSLQDPNKPIASILEVGPTGNGKTETAKAIADILGIPLVKIDMGNLQDQHAKAKLIGAPPGYIGFDKKPALEEVDENPYCVLLLDEIDKAHPDAHNIFLSILDEGRVQLMNGKTVRFNNTIIILTSNFGAREAMNAKNKSGIGFHGNAGGESAAKAEYQKAIDSKLAPEYQNRLDLIAFFGSLSKDVMKDITIHKINKVSAALRDAENLDIKLSDEALNELAELGYSPAFGARPLDRVIKNQLKVPLIEWMEKHHQNKDKLVSVFIKSVKDKFEIEFADKGNKGTSGPAAPKPA